MHISFLMNIMCQDVLHGPKREIKTEGKQNRQASPLMEFSY